MNIGGFQEISLLDYPGKIAAIIWTTGCNFRCPFCYNPDLVFDRTDHIPFERILEFLSERKGKIDAVSISGGEPLLQKDIKTIVKTIKDLGFLVKIDTNGTYPTSLKSLLKESLIDYVSMDVKTNKKNYNEIAGVTVDLSKINESIHIIQDHAKDYEFKTTIIPKYHSKETIFEIAQWLKGSKRYFLQQLKTDTSLISPDISTEKPYTKEELFQLCAQIKPFFKECNVRGI